MQWSARSVFYQRYSDLRWTYFIRHYLHPTTLDVCLGLASVGGVQASCRRFCSCLSSQGRCKRFSPPNMGLSRQKRQVAQLSGSASAAATAAAAAAADAAAAAATAAAAAAALAALAALAAFAFAAAAIAAAAAVAAASAAAAAAACLSQ
eukprot:scaffold12542_cov58-Phaeocystis_antarctica.AAC.1